MGSILGLFKETTMYTDVYTHTHKPTSAHIRVHTSLHISTEQSLLSLPSVLYPRKVPKD